MRVVMMGAPTAARAVQGELIATQLRLSRVVIDAELSAEAAVLALLQAVSADGGFVADGFPRTREEARLLDAALRARGAEVDAVVQWDDSSGSTRAELTAHYRGRIVEVAAETPVEDVFEQVMWGLREAVLVA